MRDSILYSFHFTWDSIVKFFTEQPLLFFIIGILILWSIIAQIIKARLRKKYISPYENRLNTENKEFYIKYYKKVHSLNVFGVILVLTLVITYILTKNQVIGTVLAVWIWAVLLTFQTFTVSFIMYFLLMKDYKVWDYIKLHIDDLDIQGEILYIKGLYLWISGKNDFWESTGEFHVIPNNQVWSHVISRVNLAQDTYTKSTLTIPYDNSIFRTSFDETVEQLESFLNNFLPVRAAAQVGNYKTFIGVKYKIGFSYEEDKSQIWIGFICKRSEGEKKRRAILSFIENLKK